jgi:rare lipoprotein A
MRTTASRIPLLAAAFASAAFAVPVTAAAQDPAPASSGGVEATVDRPGLDVRPGALLDRTLRIRGRTTEGDAGRPVTLERQDAVTGAWLPVATAVVAQDGTFSAVWRTDVVGRVTLRALVGREDAASAASGPLVARTTVFRPAVASWYGPGFWGRRTACGMKLTRRTVGVAHRTLPCGTQVELYRGGRTLTVPVIDRGPFVAGRDWDLTQAAAEQLGVKATGRIGFLAPPGVPLRRRG